MIEWDCAWKCERILIFFIIVSVGTTKKVALKRSTKTVYTIALITFALMQSLLRSEYTLASLANME